jgi:hypothetical protein
MRTTLNAVLASYLKAKILSFGTRNEYFSTLRKWDRWGRCVPIEDLRRREVREFLDWVYERAIGDGDEPRSDREQGPRAPARHPFLGVGAGTPGGAAPVPETPPST